MVIALHTTRDAGLPFGSMLEETLIQLVHQLPEHSFYWLGRPAQHHPANLQLLPAASGLWQQLRIPSLFRKIQPHVLVSTSPWAFSGNRPRCLVVPQPGLLAKKPGGKPSLPVMHRLRTADALVVFSDWSAALLQQWGVSPHTIQKVSLPAPEAAPLAEERRQMFLEAYTEGWEYLFCLGTQAGSGRLLFLLKAFSQFKRRQKTGMKLVLDERIASEDRDGALLPTYKYREDVVVAPPGPGWEGWIAASYAFVDLSGTDGWAPAVLHALQLGVPVITTSGAAGKELAAEAALHAAYGEPEALSEQLMLVYKDEALRGRLVEAGRKVSGRYSRQQTVAHWRAALAAAVQSNQLPSPLK